MTDPHSSFADLLSHWLLFERLSFNAAGEQLGVSPSTIAGWRRGQNLPTKPMTKRIAPLMGVDVKVLQDLIDLSVVGYKPKIDNTIRLVARVLNVNPTDLQNLVDKYNPPEASHD